MDEKVLNILQNIEKRLTDLEKNMNELSKKTVHSFHLDIKNVQTLNLDELSYYLEHIDVKELSGTLNIGNTFPSQTNQYQAPGKKGKKTTNESDVSRKSGSQNNKEKGPSEISVKINERSVPYTLTHTEEMGEPDQALQSTFSIGDILSYLEEKDISEVYNESQDGKPPQWLDTMIEEQKKEMDETKLNEDEKGE